MPPHTLNRLLRLGLALAFLAGGQAPAASFCEGQRHAAKAARARLDGTALTDILARVRDPCPAALLNEVRTLMTQVAGEQAQAAFGQGRLELAERWLQRAPTTTWYTLAVRGDIAAARRQWDTAADSYNRALDLTPPETVLGELTAMAGQATVLVGTLAATLQRSGDGTGLYNSRGSYLSIPAPVHFDYDRHTLTPDGRDAAERLAAFVAKRLQHDPDRPVSIVGHTDARGSDGYNCRLSIRRARAVAQVVEDTLRRRVKIAGKGEQAPFPLSAWSPQLTQEERYALDRRVELVFAAPGPTQETTSCTAP